MPAVGEIAISGVIKDFGEGVRAVRALDGIDLRIEPGSFVSILGPSGCGKSTLLALLAGLEAPTAGSVEIGGSPLLGPNTAAGVVFQQDLLLDWRSALDNVLLQFEIRGQQATPHRDKALAILNQVGVGAFADRYPYQLSGGMRQRVAICRALVHDPTMLLMDEPFGALDAITREQMAVDLAALSGGAGKSVVFVTHSIEEAVFLGDRVLVMSARPGRIVADIRVDVARPRTTWPHGLSEFDRYIKEARKALERGGAYGRAVA
jgi:NitT/TauT family transport system ATP-binding protein